MKFKYALSLFLAMVMLFTASVPIFAKTFDIDINNPQGEMSVDVSYVWGGYKVSGDGDSEEIDVEYTISQYYEVVIPASVTMVKDQTVMAELSANKVVVAKEQALVFRISSENYDEGWTLMGTDGNRQKYSIKAGGEELGNNGIAFSCPGGTTSNSGNIAFSPLGYSKAGSYTDLLTFSVAVE